MEYPQHERKFLGWFLCTKSPSIISWLDTLVHHAEDRGIQHIFNGSNPAGLGWLPVILRSIHIKWETDDKDQCQYKSVAFQAGERNIMESLKKYRRFNNVSSLDLDLTGYDINGRKDIYEPVRVHACLQISV